MDHVWGYATDRRLRDNNEDSLGVFTSAQGSLLMVCDGMGGHAGGGEASAIAVRIIHDTMLELQDLPPAQALVESIQAANQTVYETSRKVRRLLGMGTTAAVMLVIGDEAWVAHVGDSRVYQVRGEQAELLTRDHTMVNLFVDAELLSPEDAQSHPEAHILARSVGVDRHVEVDVQGPIKLMPGDVLLACSDGVHGSVHDDELAEIDWSVPQRGVEQVLRIVRGREGDDNATIVAFAFDLPVLERPPASAVPSPEILKSMGSSSTGGTEIGGIATPIPQAPRPAIRMPSAGGGFVLDAGPDGPPDASAHASQRSAGLAPLRPQPSRESRNRPTIAPPPTPSPAPRAGQAPPQHAGAHRPQGAAAAPAPSGGVAAGGVAAGTPAPTTKKAAGATLSRPVVLLGGAALAAGALVAGVLWLGSGERAPASPTPGLAPAEVQVITDPGVEVGTAPLTTPGEDTDTDTDTDTTANPAAPPWRFAPIMPQRSQRVAHRPSRYVQPPPGGPLELEAVLAARNRECVAALDAVFTAMEASMDYATLYGEAWDCFTDNHQGWLSRSDVRSVEDFSALLVHFQGHGSTRPDVLRLPEWARPASGGIEYRMDRLLDSTEQDLFSDVMMDRMGGPALAEQLARDTSIETQAAVALARTEAPSEEVQQWWARRVYYATRAMEGLPGDLISEYRPELKDAITAQLDVATGGLYADETAAAEDLPDAVRDAVSTGLGRMPAPEGSHVAPPRTARGEEAGTARPPGEPVPRPAPHRPRPAPPEPDVEPDTEAPHLIIHRGGEDPMPPELRPQGGNR